MSLLARLAPHLPYVRRYARALTGDQSTGDNYMCGSHSKRWLRESSSSRRT